MRKVEGAGEMSQKDLEQGGEFYDERKFLEQICKDAGIKCKVKPFDVYQGPYAELDNGGKLWFSDQKDTLLYEDPNGNKTLSKNMVKFLKTIVPFKPKLAYKDNAPSTNLKREPRKSTPEERQHLRLVKSALMKVLGYGASFSVGVLTFDQAKAKLGNKDKLGIGHNTWLVKTNDGYGIKYHNTVIIDILPHDLYALHVKGWQTSTTAIRMNQLSPIQVYTYKREWYYGDRGSKKLFEEGMIVNKKGDVVG